MVVGGILAAMSTGASGEPRPLVEAAPQMHAPPGYRAYVVRLWGTGLRGKASAIVADENALGGIRIIFSGDESLGDDAPRLKRLTVGRLSSDLLHVA